MPDHVITADLLLNVQGQKLAKEIEDSIGSGIKSASDDVKRNLSRAYREAVVSGITSGQAGDAWKNLLKSGVVEAQQQFEKVAQKLMAAEKRLSETKDKNLQKRLKEEVKLLSRQANAAEKIYRDKDRAIKREHALMRDAAKEARQGSPIGDRMQQRAEGLRGLLSGGPLSGNLTRGLQGLGQRVHTAGEARVQQAQMAGMNGAPNQQVATMAKAGRALAKVGASLATIAAAVGAVVVLVKLFADLESKIKDMNKVLVESAGSADFGLSSAEIQAGKLRDSLEEIRDETTGVNENFRKFRATAKEQQQLLSTMNQAGFTYAKMNKEIERSTELVKSYSDITAIAITYGRNLGVSANQVAQTMGEMSVESGQNLDQIAEGFAVVQREAMSAGFSTKRFFSTVVEATSGMAFYGVRLEETAKILSELGGIMGEVAGANVFKEVMQGAPKSYQERLKEYLVKDREAMREDLEIVYEQRIAQYEREYEGLLGGKTVRQVLEEAATGTELSANLRGTGLGGQQIQNLVHLHDMKRGVGGGFAGMAFSRDSAGVAYEMVQAIRTMEGLGGGTVAEVVEQALQEGDPGIARLEALTKIQGKENLNAMVQLDRQFRGSFMHLQRVAEGSEEMSEDLKKLGYFVKDGKIFKGVLDESGSPIKDASAKELKRHTEMMLVHPFEDSDVLKKQLSDDQRVAMEMSRQVTGLNEIMEQSVTAILNDIYDVLVNIAEWLFKDDPQRQAELDLQNRMNEKAKEAAEHLKSLEDQQDAINRKVEKGEDLNKLEEMQKKNLPLLLSAAMDEAEIAQTAAEYAKGMTGAEIGTDINEAIRELRARAGDAYAGTEEAKQRSSRADARARALTGASSGEESWYDWSNRMSGDIQGAFSLGGATGALLQRGAVNLGGAGLASQAGTRGRRLLGMEGFADLSDDEINEIAAAAQKGAEDVYKNRHVTRDLLGVGTASNRASIQAQSSREVATTLHEIEKSTKETAQASKDGAFTGNVLDYILGATKAKDLIIPAGGGKPVITDERDTLMAFQPGGPISKGMGGSVGGGGGVNIQIYGGDQKKVYDTVMRVLKATGNA